MPEQSSGIIDGTENAFVNANGEPAADANREPANGVTGGGHEPQIINGYDVEGPDTVKLDAGATFDGGPTRKRRGRKPGGQSGKSTTGGEAEKPNHISGLRLEDLLYSLHLMGAEILKAPMLELDKSESKKLADAIAEVAKYHAINIDPRKVAYFNLAAVAGGIYGTRLLAYRNSIAAAKRARPVEMPRKPAAEYDFPDSNSAVL